MFHFTLIFLTDYRMFYVLAVEWSSTSLFQHFAFSARERPLFFLGGGGVDLSLPTSSFCWSLRVLPSLHQTDTQWLTLTTTRIYCINKKIEKSWKKSKKFQKWFWGYRRQRIVNWCYWMFKKFRKTAKILLLLKLWNWNFWYWCYLRIF